MNSFKTESTNQSFCLVLSTFDRSFPMISHNVFIYIFQEELKAFRR